MTVLISLSLATSKTDACSAEHVKLALQLSSGV